MRFPLSLSARVQVVALQPLPPLSLLPRHLALQLTSLLLLVRLPILHPPLVVLLPPLPSPTPLQQQQAQHRVPLQLLLLEHSQGALGALAV